MSNKIDSNNKQKRLNERKLKQKWKRKLKEVRIINYTKTLNTHFVAKRNI